MKKKELKLEKLVIARISNMRSIVGGIEDQYSIEIECDLTTRPKGDTGSNNCDSRDCDEPIMVLF